MLALPRFTREPVGRCPRRPHRHRLPALQHRSPAPASRPAPSARRTREVLDDYLARGLPFLWWTTPSTSSPDLERVLTEAGMLREDTPGMHVALDGPASTDLPPGVELRLHARRHGRALRQPLPLVAEGESRVHGCRPRRCRQRRPLAGRRTSWIVDTTAPTVCLPDAHRAAGSRPAANVTATFSEAMRESTRRSHGGDGLPLAITLSARPHQGRCLRVTYAETASRRVPRVLDPTRRLKPGKEYKVSVHSTKSLDLAGNAVRRDVLAVPHPRADRPTRSSNRCLKSVTRSGTLLPCRRRRSRSCPTVRPTPPGSPRGSRGCSPRSRTPSRSAATRPACARSARRSG